MGIFHSFQTLLIVSNFLQVKPLVYNLDFILSLLYANVLFLYTTHNLHRKSTFSCFWVSDSNFFCVYWSWSILGSLLVSLYDRCLLAFPVTRSNCHYNAQRLSYLQPDAKVNKIKAHQIEVMPKIWNDSPNKKTHMALSLVIDDLFD